MKVSNSYPYPVLQKDNDDYFDSIFEVKYNTTESFGELRIEISIRLVNDTIKTLIEDNQAEYLLHVECSQTSFRKVFLFSEVEFSTTIKLFELRGKISLHTFIIAKKDIFDYTNHLLNDWYKEMKLTFEKGNIMGIGDAIEVTLQEEHTDLMDLPSIVDIYRSQKSDYMEVDMLSQNILISLPAFEYDLYASYANTIYKNTIISMVILPSLIYVFSKIQETKEEIEEYTWYQVMEKIFKENNYKIEDVGTDKLPSLTAAQLILRKPLKSGFMEIENISNTGD